MTGTAAVVTGTTRDAQTSFTSPRESAGIRIGVRVIAVTTDGKAERTETRRTIGRCLTKTHLEMNDARGLTIEKMKEKMKEKMIGENYEYTFSKKS